MFFCPKILGMLWGPTNEMFELSAGGMLKYCSRALARPGATSIVNYELSFYYHVVFII